MRFSVSVPVLSVQMTVVLPKVSTAVSRRMMARCRAMRRTPRARIRVVTAGSPSGTAATAKLLARLVKSGHIRRETHPTDRRAQLLFATPDAQHEVRKTLGAMHERMLSVAQDFSPGEQHAIIRFLDAMSSSVHAPDEEPRATRRPVLRRHRIMQ